MVRAKFSEFAEKRCAVKGSVEGAASWAWQSCPASCGTRAYECDGGRADSTTWHKKGDPTKRCEWVAAFYVARAAVVGEDGTMAFESCPAATRVCSYGACDDAESWVKRASPSKDCAWVSTVRNRCASRGDDCESDGDCRWLGPKAVRQLDGVPGWS